MTSFDIDACISLRDSENYTWNQIAEFFGNQDTPNAIRKRYARAKKREDMTGDPGIQEALAEVGIGDTLKVKGGWLKTDSASIRFETPNEDHSDNAFDDYVAMLRNGLSVIPKSIATSLPKDTDDQLLARYILTDLHGGLAASVTTSDGDYDLDTMDAILNEATMRLVAAAPPAETAIIQNLGDVFHANDSKKVTPESGHVLDMVKEAFPEIAMRVTRAIIRMIEALLRKHAFVRYVGVAGNHDRDQFHWLTIALMMRFENDPRVEIVFNQRKLYVETFGSNLIAMAHGDRVTFQRLANQIADVHAVEWGQTRWRYCDTGHVHHDRTDREVGGIYCESHRTLAPTDAAAFGFGFQGRQTAKVIINHRDRGEISRHTASFS